MSHSDSWNKFYSKRIKYDKVYPTEWVIRVLAGANYPSMKLDKQKFIGANILDLSCGDGRNLNLLQDLGFSVHATEISQEIITSLQERSTSQGWNAEFRSGLNIDLPYDDDFFDYILSCWSFYYMPDGASFSDILHEISRVLKKDGYFIAGIPDRENYALIESERQKDGSVIIKNDPFGLRNDVRWMVAGSADEVRNLLSPLFYNVCLGHLIDNYFDLNVSGYIFVCQKT